MLAAAGEGGDGSGNGHSVLVLGIHIVVYAHAFGYGAGLQVEDVVLMPVGPVGRGHIDGKAGILRRLHQSLQIGHRHGGEAQVGARDPGQLLRLIGRGEEEVLLVSYQTVLIPGVVRVKINIGPVQQILRRGLLRDGRVLKGHAVAGDIGPFRPAHDDAGAGIQPGVDDDIEHEAQSRHFKEPQQFIPFHTPHLPFTQNFTNGIIMRTEQSRKP